MQRLIRFGARVQSYFATSRLLYAIGEKESHSIAFNEPSNSARRTISPLVCPTISSHAACPLCED